MKTEIFETNAGGLIAIVRDEGKVTNIVTGLEAENVIYHDFINAARWGFEDADTYDPDDFSGLDIDAAAAEIENSTELVAEITPDRIELDVRSMGIAAKKLFCIDVD